MAGGPPHRGRLLEAISAEQVAVDPEGYQRVVQELRRGIGLASGLPTVESSALGWVGVCCSDEAMAAWMLRAIVIENVMVRREGKVLYLPAGPHFRIEKEIKNVITTVAKTAHYWQAHLRTRQPPKPL
jgi:sirohydrochlorin cobaltochelatase